MLRTVIFGAGPIGAAIAHRLAERSRVREVVLIDENARLAEGKALDIRQSGPIDGSNVILSAATDPLAAVGADVIVFADDTVNGALDRERGLVAIERLIRAGSSAPIVFAGPAQLDLLEACVRELHVAPDRLIGAAAAAMPSIVASLVNAALGQTGATVAVTGRPPAFVVAWGAASIAGALVGDRLPPHRMLAISQSLPRCWPPGPEAIAAPAARLIEGLMLGSREPFPALVMLDGELGVRGRAGLLPVELGNGRVLTRVPPTLTPQERTETVTSLMR